jgi:hypothetical protein
MLPNGMTGVVTMKSPIKTMEGGLLRGRDKVKVRYITDKGGVNESWFQLRDLRSYELVPKKVPNVVQPPNEGDEPWKDHTPKEEIIPIDQSTLEVEEIKEIGIVDACRLIRKVI